jgi:hypothetical protein
MKDAYEVLYMKEADLAWFAGGSKAKRNTRHELVVAGKPQVAGQCSISTDDAEPISFQRADAYKMRG